MTTYYLRFPDEATAQSVLEKAGIYIAPTDEDPGHYRRADIGWGFDPIGIITKDGIWDPDTGAELVPPTVVPGWHANYAGDTLPAELTSYRVDPEPSTPYRVFA